MMLVGNNLTMIEIWGGLDDGWVTERGPSTGY